MKKVFSIIAVAFTAAAFVACGPSAEEKAKMEERAKFVADSTAAAISNSMQNSVEAVVDSAVSTATEAAAAAVEEKK